MLNVDFFREKRTFFIDNKKYDSLLSIPNLRLDENALQPFLKLGFVPGDCTLFDKVKCTHSSNGNEVDLESLFGKLPNRKPCPSELNKILIEVISDIYVPGSQCVVPLSGGMDSRIILAALCELTDAANIHTYTFGVPGAYDYEIPNQIAKRFGTKHANFSAKNTEYTVEGLVRAAIASDGNTEVFHPLVLNNVADYYGNEVAYWSGFAGDLVGGAFGSKLSGASPKTQLIEYEKRGIHFLDDGVCDTTLEPYISLGSKMAGYVSENEACFWENHVERYTGHHIFRNDMTIHSPFVDMRILKFFFSLPLNERANKKFFNEAFSEIYPEAFRFPTKDYGYKYSSYQYLQLLHNIKFFISALGWRVAPNVFTHPNAAYIDMHHAINNRADVRRCVDELLAGLAKRNIIDNKRMFYFLKEHRSGRNVYTKDIINLASLEVILMAAKL